MRGPATHVIIIDGTMASLAPDRVTHAGTTALLLREMGAGVSVYYEPGIQWSHWRRAGDVLFGRGINRQIRRAYGYLASRYRPGDRVFFFGYSRGAYAVRSLAGVIDLVGLLKTEHATHRNVRAAYRHYECTPDSAAARAFSQQYCYETIDVELVGVWDTVKALGVNLPVLWRLSAPRHAFHSHHLGRSVKRGLHALAFDETRVAYTPVMWETSSEWSGHLEQRWFPGTHGDIGGQLSQRESARPLSNLSLVWMLSEAESFGLPLPENWQDRFPQDAAAPSIGTFSGFGRYFVTRRARTVGKDPSETLHPAVATQPRLTGWVPRWAARWMARGDSA
ncbi:MAG: DUF2235 domain-containing protein [Pseudomonadota bacterium]